MELLDDKEMCSSHIYCKSKCCLEPRKRIRKRRGRKGGGRGLQEDDVEEDTKDADEVDLSNDKKKKWENGDRFCLKSDFC